MPISRIEPYRSTRVSRVQGVQGPQFLNFRDLKANYRFPGSKQLLEWKQNAPFQPSAMHLANVFHAEKASQDGFTRISRIGDGEGETAPDDRAAIGLILEAVNSSQPEVKRTGLQYMQALLDQGTTPEKRKFIYDSIVNNLINSVGWEIEQKQDYVAGREILERLDTFSLMVLRQYNIYPNLDLQSLLQPRGLSHRVIDGSSDFNDIQSHLQGRLLPENERMPILQMEDDDVPQERQRAEFHDIVGFSGFNQITIVFGEWKLRLGDLIGEMPVRV